MKTSNVDTTTNLGAPSIPSIPEQTLDIQPKVSMAKLASEEVRTSGIVVHISHMDTNVNKVDGMSTFIAQGIFSILTSSVHVSIVLSSTIKSTLIDSSTSLPPFIIPIPTSLPISTTSPTFQNILNQPITFYFFPPQSTEGTTSTPVVDQEDDEIMVSFADIQFDTKEVNIPDHMRISGKQLKILHRKLNYLLQLHADVGSRNSISGIEVDVLLKAQEHRLKAVMDQIDTKNEQHLKRQSESFNHEVKDLRVVAKE